MKILLLADPSSIHTIRWAHSLSARGLKVFVFGLNDYKAWQFDIAITVYSARIKAHGLRNKLRYITALPKLRRFIRRTQPDIVHAHYASSYGMLGALCGRKPFIISVWGSDVYDFPRRSQLHALLLRKNLEHADRILSTSRVMAEETLRYAKNKEIEVTPFGVDVHMFRRMNDRNSGSPIRIGTIKTLHSIYGIHILIEAFSIVKKKYAEPITLTIAGDGTEREKLKILAEELSVADAVQFLGKIPHEEVPELLNTFSVFCALSLQESFGVAVIEASACEIPVLVSDAEGLREVVEHGVTGLIVPRNDVRSAAQALEYLISNDPIRQQMGTAGRERVMQYYNWKENVGRMVDIYHQTMANNKIWS